VITGLTGGTTYSVTVRASNVVGVAFAATCNTLVGWTPPSAPTTLTPWINYTSLSVTFNPATSMGYPSSNTYYLVTATPGGACGVASSSPVTVNGLTPGTAYSLSICTVNMAGASSALTCATSTNTTGIVPLQPVGLSASIQSSVLTLSGTASVDNGAAAITGFLATFTATSNAPSSNPITAIYVTGSTLPITISALNVGTTYTMTLQSSNVGGLSMPSPALTSATYVYYFYTGSPGNYRSVWNSAGWTIPATYVGPFVTESVTCAWQNVGSAMDVGMQGPLGYIFHYTNYCSGTGSSTFYPAYAFNPGDSGYFNAWAHSAAFTVQYTINLTYKNTLVWN